jgi:hypothetical protein
LNIQSYPDAPATISILKIGFHIAQIGFELQHLERIDQLQFISKEMWKCYHDESQPLKKVQILWYLATVQPYLSQYYEATMGVIKQTANLKHYYVPKFEHGVNYTL